MKNLIKNIDTVWKVAAAVFVLFIGISIISYCYGKNLSFFIGGWLASFVISGLFYLFGIKPFIKPQLKETIILEIAKTCAGSCAADKNYAEKKEKENENKKDFLRNFFPKTVNFIENYFSTFGGLLSEHNLSSNYSDFVQPERELCFLDEATTEDKNVTEEAREEFFKKFNKILYKELIIN